jgi:hypothetical protein
MGGMMSHTEVKKSPTTTCVMSRYGDQAENVPMHPDDFEAHYAWIMAKRFHELVLKERIAEKPVYYRIIG